DGPPRHHRLRDQRRLRGPRRLHVRRALPDRRRRDREELRARCDHGGGDRRRQRLRRVRHGARRRPRRDPRRDDPGRLHAPADLRVLAAVLQRLRDRRRGHGRRARHAPAAGRAPPPSRRGARGPPGGGERMRSLATRALARWETLLVAGIVGVGIWGATLPYFFTTANLLDLTTQYAFIALAAFGLSFVVIAGEIDISIVSNLAVSVVCF